ncbi:MAG: class I SAM-dependent methyltransferase [Deltaproteobacteria bacterium]|nr:class I SAM-dependent methyltransferase [Deltaproteobacteria bacterium]
MFNDSIKNYLQLFNQIQSPLLRKLKIDNESRNDVQPHICAELAGLLNFLILSTGAVNILELGTSNGFSTISMGEAVKENNGQILSIDSKHRLHLEAIKNVEDAGLNEYIELVYADAADYVNSLDTQFDLIFQDCGKYLYRELLEKLISLLAPGGILIADDTLFKPIDTIRDSLSDYMHQYNMMVFNDKRLVSVILPIGMGVTLSWKRK